MKKGGVREVNSFISMGPSQWTRDPAIKKHSGNAITSTSTSSKAKSTTKKAPDPVAKSVKSPEKTDTEDSRILKRSASIKSSGIVQTKKPENKSSNITKDNAKSSSLSGTMTSNRNFRNSIAEEKRAISSHKTTMDDVLKRSKLVDFSKTRKTITNNNSAPTTRAENIIEPTMSPEVNKTIDNKLQIDAVEDNSDYDYEDDFEDYESTFESYSGSESIDSLHQDLETAVTYSEDHKIIIEEEKKMDSGSYDLMSRKQIQKERNQLDVIREALQKENSSLNSYGDFKESFTSADQYLSSTIVSDFRTELLLNFNDKSMQNFSNAKIKQRNSKTARMIQTRGEKLMKMISLDTMNYVLYEQPTVPYEIFMRTFARQNTKQVYTQTNEDNLSCEIQTEEIISKSKWTQYPVRIRSSELNKNNLVQLLAGVADENTTLADAGNNEPKINTRKMNNFITTYGEEMIAVLEENLHETEIENTDSTGLMATKISVYVSRIRYNSIPTLSERPVLSVHYDPHDSARLLTVHRKEKTKRAGYCLLCVWNIYQPWKPKLVLKSYGNVSCVCFVSSDSSYIVAGHEDGTLCVWNLFENDSYLVEENSDGEKISFKILFPSYNTAEVLKNANHGSRVVQVDAIQTSENNQTEQKQEMVYSIEEENKLIIWTLSTYSSQKVDEGSAPWSRIKFFINQTINITQLSPKDVFQTTLAKVLSEFQILLGTNAGYVIKFNLYSNKLKKYRKSSISAVSNERNVKVTSLEVCPYNKLYFAVAHATGDISLFHTSYAEPVCEIRCDNYNYVLAPIAVQWLWSDQNYILALDSCMRLKAYKFWSSNHVATDLFGAEQKEKIESVVVSPFLLGQRVLNFTILTESEIQIHKLISLDKLEDTNTSIQ